MNIPIIGEIKLGGMGRVLIALLALMWIISPFDFDWIPIVGWIDDFIAAIIGFTALFGGEK